jgi:hypothetical protein
LRDAKKFGFVPSVTTIRDEAMKWGLVDWMKRQVAWSTLTIPRIDGESDSDLVERIMIDSDEQARLAREKGTEIHAMVERGFLGLEVNPYYLSVKGEIWVVLGKQTFQAEKSFAHNSSQYWYGGKVDLYNDDILIDIKTTEKDISTLKTWDEHAMQLAAYDFGLGGNTARRCFICYVNSITAEARLVEVDDIRRGWAMFTSLLEYYYAKTGL